MFKQILAATFLSTIIIVNGLTVRAFDNQDSN